MSQTQRQIILVQAHLKSNLHPSDQTRVEDLFLIFEEGNDTSNSNSDSFVSFVLLTQRQREIVPCSAFDCLELPEFFFPRSCNTPQHQPPDSQLRQNRKSAFMCVLVLSQGGFVISNSQEMEPENQSKWQGRPIFIKLTDYIGYPSYQLSLHSGIIFINISANL